MTVIAKLKKSNGISLLELMLSLVLISILLMMAMRYYLTTSAAEKSNSAITMLNQIATASDDWFDTFKTYNNITKRELVTRGTLPHEFNVNPWGGTIDISNANNKVVVTMSGVPQSDCINLQAVLKNRMTLDCSKNLQLIATYPNNPK